MFEILFGWRKASKCKRLLRRVQCRLKLLMNKRDSIVRQLREDIAELIQRGHEQSAFARVEQLCKDQNIKTVYGLIEHFCEFILINLPYIRRNRDCPNDINEAVSSLIFASARCGDLPELQKLRKLFGERYGHKFAMIAVELLAGNLVNRQIIEKLSTKSIADDVKLGIMEEIARDKNLQLGSPDEDSKFGVEHHKVSDHLLKNCELERVQQAPDRDNQFASIASDNKELRERSLFYDETIIDQQKQVANPCKSVADAAIVLQTDADMNKSAIELEKHEQRGPLQELKRMAGGAPSESLSNLSERSIVYLDDITEFKPKTNDVVDRDQSLFMFDSTINKGCLSDLYCDGFTRDQIEPCEQSDGKTSSRGSSSSSTWRRKSPMKRLKRRYQSSILPALSMKNPEYTLYYGEPGDSSSTEDEKPSQESHPQRKHQRKMSVEESLISSFTAYHRNAFKTSNKVRCKLSHDVDADCFLDHPRYLCTSDYKNDWEIASPRLQSGLVKTTKLPNKNSKRGACKDEYFRCHRSMDDETFSTTITGNCKSYGNHSQFKVMEKAEVMDCRASCASSRDSCSSATSSSTQANVNARMRPPYLRAVTMPPERPKGTSSYQILRSQSCLNNDSERSSPFSSCSHVHPKLPDYDDLAIKFKALKEECRQISNGEVSSCGIRRA